MLRKVLNFEVSSGFLSDIVTVCGASPEPCRECAADDEVDSALGGVDAMTGDVLSLFKSAFEQWKVEFLRIEIKKAEAGG